MESVLEAVFRIKVNSDKALSYDDAIKHLREHLMIVVNGPLKGSIAIIDLNTLKFTEPVEENDHVIVLHDEDDEEYEEEYDEDEDNEDEEDDEEEEEANLDVLEIGKDVTVTKRLNGQNVVYVGVLISFDDDFAVVEFADEEQRTFPIHEVQPFHGNDYWDEN
jgi:hypothetical protein